MRRTTIFANPDHLKRLAEIAKSKGLGTSSMIRLLITDCIDQENQKARAIGKVSRQK